MNVYIYRYGSICEPDVISSLKKLGLNVDEETIEITQKNLMPSECINIVSPKLINNSYAFVFSINFFPWLSDLCEITHTVYISLIVDSPVMELYSNSLKNSINRVFLFDRQLYNEFVSVNPKNIFHIPLAADVNRIQNTINSCSHEDKEKYKCDISFVGSTYQEKCPYNRLHLPEYEQGYANGIIESQLNVYGYNFIEELLDDNFINVFLENNPDIYHFPEGYTKNYKACIAQLYLSVKVAEQERLRALKMLSDFFNVDIYTGSDTSSMPNINNRGFAKSLEEMPIIFNQSKINLNITSKSIRTALPQRIFDVLGSGGFLITNYQSEIPDIFEIGSDLVTYSSMSELKELCEYYLNHEDERLAIAQNGFNKVKNMHTTDIRLLQMISMAFPKAE